MLSIANLIDHSAVGGVTRMIADQTTSSVGRLAMTQLEVRPRDPLAPRVMEDVAVIHFSASWSKLPFLALLRAQRGNRPIVLVEHTYTASFERECVPNARRFRAMLRLAYRLADRIVSVSKGQAAWLLDAGVVPAAKLAIIEPSVDCATMEALPLPQWDGGRPLRLAAYGRYATQKGLDTMLDAIALLPKGSATMTMGGYGPDAEKLASRAAALENVIVGGPVNDVAAFLRASDAVVIPSRWEAYGLVGLEARSAGRPIIVVDVDGLPEQAGAGAGLVVPPNAPMALANAIKSLDPNRHAAMAAAARASAAQHHARHIDRWIDLLEGLTTSGGPKWEQRAETVRTAN